MIQAVQSDLAKAIANKKRKINRWPSREDTLNSLMNGSNYIQKKICLASFNGIQKAGDIDVDVKTK